MFEHIYINNYRHFVNFELNLKRTTLLCGLNGTGKSSIIELISKLRDFIAGTNSITMEKSSVGYLCPMEDVTRWRVGDYGNEITTFEFKYSDGENQFFHYSLKIKSNFKSAVCRVEEEILKLNEKTLYSYNTGEAQVTTDDEKSREFPCDWNFSGLTLAARYNSRIKKFVCAMGDSVHALSINPHSFSAKSKISQHLLEMSGANFSSWYSWIVDNHLKNVAEAFEDYGYFIPNFKQFALKEMGGFQELRAEFALADKTYSLSFDELSHGQKILCILYLLFRTVPNNSTIFIDEFENYLAPSELQPIYDFAYDNVHSKQLQLVLVSHHQKTLNWYHKNAVILSALGDPAIVRAQYHNPEETSLTLEETIQESRQKI